MLQRVGKRKFLKPDQRARLWSHKIKDAAVAAAGRGLGRSLRGLPRRIVTDEQLRSWTSAPDVLDAYETFWDRVRAQADDHRPESVPQADCFALFALTKAIGARQALEIGTHLGFSTLHIAAALSGNGTQAKLTTVDIVDVNDEEQARYKSFGALMSARQRLRNIGLEHRVQFVVSPSEAFLKRTSETYDIIFVDGDHSEVGAYFDIAWSLMRLSDRGIIVLHDVNDPDDPTPGLDGEQYGVHWALHRLRSHVPDIDAVRLRTITPPGSRAPVPTSLAVVTRR